MNQLELAQYFDHTLLRASATAEEIRRLCAEAAEHKFFAVCVNPVYLPLVRHELSGGSGSSVAAAVVVGFPLGANSPAVKVYETQQALQNGAQEIDMVINIGAYLGGQSDVCFADMRSVIKAAGSVPVKVILETAYLSPMQIAELTKVAADSGAAFVKTSSGFAPRGATVEDITIMAETLSKHGFKNVGIKASGGIKDWPTAKALIDAGATRIGSSASVQIIEQFFSAS